MGSNGEGRRFQNLDRISNLPSELAEEILHRLPIRDAVKTSLLSRGWRYRWTTMSRLVFDTRSIPPYTTQEQLQQIQPNLVNFVNKVFSLHKGSNTTLSVFKLNHFLKTSCSDLDQWILDASYKKFKQLTLRFRNWSDYELPACFFSCQSLKIILLEGCLLKLPSEFQPLRRVTGLILFRVTLADETLEALLVNVPNLRMLGVIHCKPLTIFNIHAPNLLDIVITRNCEGIRFKTATKIKKAVFDITASEFSKRCKLDQVLGALGALQTITIHHPVIEVSPMGALEKLQITYHHLTYASVHLNIEDSNQILATLCLCRSSPCLNTLKITANWSREAARLDEENFWEARLRKEDNVFHHLKIAQLDGFKGVQHDIGFTQFIMLNAVVLETFSINWGKSVKVHEKQHVVENTMQYPRASSNAKVVFNKKVLVFHVVAPNL